MLNVIGNDIKNSGRTEGRKEKWTDGKSHILRWLKHLKKFELASTPGQLNKTQKGSKQPQRSKIEMFDKRKPMYYKKFF